jgi:ABC-type transporter Mla subunit MlaD
MTPNRGTEDGVNDLVERLRRDDPFQIENSATELMEEAANEIERLRALVEDLITVGEEFDDTQRWRDNFEEALADARAALGQKD